jgi:hypothetical protein
MPGQEIPLDDLLNMQASSAQLAVVQGIDGDDSNVKVKPYVAGAGCSCDLELTIPKDAISRLVTTDETHPCCGKLLTVVQIEFSNDTYTDVFSQLRTKLAERQTQRPISTSPYSSFSTSPYSSFSTSPYSFSARGRSGMARPMLECLECDAIRENCFNGCRGAGGHPNCFRDCIELFVDCLNACGISPPPTV